MKYFTASLVLGAMLSLLTLIVKPTWADNTVQANRDTWIADNAPGTNFQANANPSSQLRNAGSVRRVSLYEFTLPRVGPCETVTGAELRMEEYFFASGETTGSYFTADFGVLSGAPDLTTITYNSAISDGYVAAGNDANQNPIIGPNTTLAGEAWTVSDGRNALRFVDNNASNGFAQLVKNAAGPTPQTKSFMLTPVDPTAGATVAAFYGAENGESNVFFPHPRLTVRSELTTVTHEIEANADVWIASNSPDTNFEGGVNPSTQLRNNSGVTRAALYSFTLPQLSAGQTIEGVQLDLVQFFDDGHFSADFALLASNPNLSAITWNSAIADSFITGVDGSFNPILGANATGAGELWELFGDNTDSQRFTDGDAANGLAQLIAAAASTAGPVDITLLLVPRGQADLTVASFYGMENGEGDGFFPHPRLKLTVVNSSLHPGDFDGDGDVDGADFVAWQTHFPTASGATLANGDADGDGDVDGADFVVWQTNFPFTPGPGATTVPEPASVTLLFFSAAAISWRRCGRKK